MYSFPIVRLLALATFASPAVALDVFKFDPAINLRFSHGTYADVRLDENPTFLLAGHDLSGLGWGPGNFGVTLVSPRHFLTAAHVAPLPGSTVSFRNREGVIKHYAVESLFTVEHRAGVRTDLVLGRLVAAIPSEDLVSSFPTLVLPASSDYLGLKVYSFGAYQSCGTNTIARWGNYDLLPFDRGDNVPDNILFVTDWYRVTGQAQAQGNDSGSPTFVLHRGQLALVGTHSAVNVAHEPYVTLDVLIPAYFTQIKARLARDGYSFRNAAEPAATTGTARPSP
jgi:hypothetical protein